MHESDLAKSSLEVVLSLSDSKTGQSVCVRVRVWESVCVRVRVWESVGVGVWVWVWVCVRVRVWVCVRVCVLVAVGTFLRNYLQESESLCCFP